MAFVVTTGCCNDASCVDVCPVDCIRPHPEDPAFRTAEQLYIDPDACIGCSACMYACPVSAIHDELDPPAHLTDFVALNRDYFVDQPLAPRFLPAPARSATAPLRGKVAVIGTGPSGCYAIEALSAVRGIEVTVFDRQPTPFGLVRFGVAPDHPDTKLVSDHFQSVLERPNVTCYLNVEVGTDITLADLRASHHAVIHAGGAADDRKLGIDGEALPGCHSAREFVSWYNGHPDFADRTFDLSGDTAVVLGNGNVALDVARVLTRPAELLATTDMAEHAVEAFRSSNIREVVIAGRRGPADAACTFPELLELSRMRGVDVRVLHDDVARDQGRSMSASRRRKLDLFRQLARDDAPRHPDARRITFRFGVQPVQISGTAAVDSLRLRPTGSADAPLEVIRTGLVLRAVGYEVAPVAGLPYDHSTRTLAHVEGRLVEEGTDRVVPGLYCVGWAKRGPSGVIGTNKVCSRETVDAVVADLRAGRLATPAVSSDALDATIRARQPRVVGLTGWRAIDDREREEGRSAVPPRPRRKLVRVETMLSAAGLADAAATDESLLAPVPASRV
ncbi:4Fe-4S binding protein [Geodermatophilus sabuli]|uniref:Ferredoxin--NADP+ reductase n=1 Tax=Geodermatophilus sabuli TaxID=1564158 RepID=A0A285EAA4_9ACTN|nr:4Fe-4S binding protein [Geodermatophilus sabuli]MBB3085519.1 ferredoxin--NADP+ reductase [Geodermatophilus sabuli]SNX96059.1 ferredoxin--NADP+ reductase [Geodermatophilus sabuli]